MNEWIEIKRLNRGTVYPTAIRAYSIMSVDKISESTCKIYLDDEHHYSYILAESYEDVIAKIKKVEEPVDLSNCVVEHFTMDEYEYMRALLENEGGGSSLNSKIINKLKEILKEGK